MVHPPATLRLIHSASVRSDECERCRGQLSGPDIDRFERSRRKAPRWCGACVQWSRDVQWWKRAGSIESILTGSGVLLEHASATPADFNLAPRRLLAQLYLNRGQRERRDDTSGFLVIGDVGRGKTRFGVAALRLWALAGDQVKFTMAAAMMRRIRNTYNDGATETEEAVLRDFCSVPMLMIDELGREQRITDAVKRILHEILSVRIGNYKPTIITTNLTYAEIEETYDCAIASRLQVLTRVVIDGPDRRGKGR